MPRIKTYEAFQYHEHPNQPLVLAKHRDVNTDHSWWRFTVEDIATIGGLMGLSVALAANQRSKEFYFSGFYCQGSHAYWGGYMRLNDMAGAIQKVKDCAPQDEKIHAIAARCEKLRADAPPGLRDFIVNSRRDHTSVNGDFSDIAEKDIKVARVLEEEAQSIADAFSEWGLARLQKEYEYLQSDEALISTFESNDCWFTLDGSIDS